MHQDSWAILLIAAMWALALWLWRAWTRFPTMPMHWSLSGRVTWSAPRPVALAFLPGLTLLLYIALRIGDAPARQRLLIVGLLAVIDLFYLAMAAGG